MTWSLVIKIFNVVLTEYCKSSSGDEVDWLQNTEYSTIL